MEESNFLILQKFREGNIFLKKLLSRWFDEIIIWLEFDSTTHCECENFEISLPRFFRKNSVKLTFY